MHASTFHYLCAMIRGQPTCTGMGALPGLDPEEWKGTQLAGPTANSPAMYRANAPDIALLLWRKAIALHAAWTAPRRRVRLRTTAVPHPHGSGDLDSAAFHLLQTRILRCGTLINTSRMELMEARYLMALDRRKMALPYLQRADSFAVKLTDCMRVDMPSHNFSPPRIWLGGRAQAAWPPIRR